MESGRTEIIRLTAAFRQQIETYKHDEYNEAQVRQDFIDPLFMALGWDINNQLRLPHHQRQVVLETRQLEDHHKRPDYTFRSGKERAFFVEAKRPSVNIKSEYDPAYQARSYGWSAQIPSILTDFEEFAVYHYTTKPEKKDKPAVARVLYLTYEDYEARWDELYHLFSYEAVTSGSLGRWLEKPSKGSETVDTQFLREIEGWRVQLAKTIALHNPHLNQRDLNRMVQLTIDRLIFLRIAEDRGIEPYEQLQDATENLKDEGAIYAELTRLFQQADAKYNSGLFHFKPESGRDDPDALSLTLTIDNETLRHIIDKLYFPHSPYRFAVMPAEILGNVYEQFLGKVIVLSERGKADVTEKPEVRKAGGVYYTPSYIVEYIVANTVGKLLDATLPQLKILDPACGSGSFLIGAYQYLLDWYLEFYSRDPKKYRQQLYALPDGGYQLAIEERKRILLAHIYGVDIDLQAVEVTKLSLLLKVLEGETDQTLGQMLMFKERVLPDLSQNIKWGNSLIGYDYLETRQLTLFDLDEEERYRVKMFNWADEFPAVMRAGGFDAVIGNPPYIRIQTLRESASKEVDYYNKSYVASGAGNYDIYVLFVEKGLQLLNPQGRLGFILPHKFFNAKYGAPLRGLVAQGKHLEEIVYFGHQQVFAGATTYTCLLFLSRSPQPEFEYVVVNDLSEWQKNRIPPARLASTNLSDSDWIFASDEVAQLLQDLSENPYTLGDITARIFQGLITGADDIFILDMRSDNVFYSRATQTNHHLEAELLHPLCKGSVNIRRYHFDEITRYILFPYRVENDIATLIQSDELQKSYPKIWEYLLLNRDKLEARERGKWKHDKWYAYSRNQNMNQMEQPKILTPSLANRASFIFDENDYCYFVGSGGGGGGGYGITLKSDIKISYYYLLGLLNSSLLNFLVIQNTSEFRGGYYAFNKQYIENLPIRMIDFSKPDEVAQHDKMVKLVETMLDYHRRLPSVEGETKKQLEGAIAHTDRQIDELVYHLYGLTDEEIAIVEGRV